MSAEIGGFVQKVISRVTCYVLLSPFPLARVLPVQAGCLFLSCHFSL